MRVPRRRPLSLPSLLCATVTVAAGLSTATLVSAPQAAAAVTDIRINEVVSSGGSPGDWVELKNTGTAPVDVGGLRFRDNDATHGYVIPAGTTIAAGGYYVLEEATFAFGLGATDEANLFQPDGTTVVDSYAWTSHRIPSYGRCADGTGAFTLLNTVSKGATNICPTPYDNLRVNEVESNAGTPGDWVEIKNTGTTAVDIGGVRFRDNDATHTPYAVPAGTTIAAGGYHVLEEAQFVFGLGAADSAILYQPNGTTVIDSYDWTSHATTTYGRCPDGTGPFATTASSTKGATNACGTAGPNYAAIKINEVESNGGVPGDWVELKNTGATAVDLSGIKFRDNDTTHVPYAVPAGTSLAAGGYYLVEEAQFGFGLGAADSATVWQPDGSTVIDLYSWTAHAVNTYGRCPDGTGAFVDTASPTKGAVNDCRSPIRINEVESNGGTPGDWVELVNPSTAPVDVSGYVFRDNDDTHNAPIPSGTSIAAGGYLVLDENSSFAFGLGQPDSARLFAPDGTTLIDSYAWDTHATTTYGRCPNGTGNFATTQAPTKGAVNSCPGDLTTSAWPGGQGVTTIDQQFTFASNLSGLMYEPTGTSTPGSIWAVRNGPGSLYQLTKTQTGYAPSAGFATGGKLLHYPDGTGDVDAEGVTFTSAGPSAGIYVASERNNANNGVSRPAILRYDPASGTTDLSAQRDWNLTADLPGLGPNLGLEAIAWVPDSYLTAKGFVDANTNAAYDPATYANHGTGLFLVGVEQTGNVYAYALDQTSDSYTRVATFASGFVSVMELFFEPETQKLWVVCDDTCQGRTARFDVDASGVFAPTTYYERPTGMPNLNNEGFTLAPQSECANGLKPAFWADDSSTGGYALRQGTISCTVTPPVNQVAPSITGSPAVGTTVTADPGTWSPSDVTYAYQWFANNVAISGATQQTFTPTAAQDGTLLSVRVSASRVGSAATAATSASKRVVTTPITNTTAPVVSGGPAVGSTLTLSTGTWNYPDLTYTYAWYANGAAIRGANRSSYVVTSSVAGRTITGRVTATRPGNDAVSATSSNSVSVPS